MSTSSPSQPQKRMSKPLGTGSRPWRCRRQSRNRCTAPGSPTSRSTERAITHRNEHSGPILFAVVPPSELWGCPQDHPCRGPAPDGPCPGQDTIGRLRAQMQPLAADEPARQRRPSNGGGQTLAGHAVPIEAEEVVAARGERGTVEEPCLHESLVLLPDVPQLELVSPTARRRWPFRLPSRRRRSRRRTRAPAAPRAHATRRPARSATRTWRR